MDTNRRKFLKIIFIGSGALLMERVSSSLLSRFFNNSSVKTGLRRVGFNNLPAKPNLKETSLGSFRVAESDERLSIYDSTGEEIFQIDKGGGVT